MAVEKEQAAAAGTTWEPSEEREWPEITTSPFRTVEERYVVCLDTMG